MSKVYEPQPEHLDKIEVPLGKSEITLGNDQPANDDAQIDNASRTRVAG